MGKKCNLLGMKFDRLTVIGFVGIEKTSNRAVWRCLCDCGNYKNATTFALKYGKVTSCGCKRSEGFSSTHKGTKTRLYGVWKAMRNRCYNPKNARYKDYGGRGITICDEWRYDFQAFRDWAMANGYDETALRGQCTIDRIDNDKGYFPDNCRWTSFVVQNNNRRSPNKGGK